MGCIQSKIENEEMVNRCKDRKLYMKEAVDGRNAFAAAHFAYAASLKNTGATLSDYAQGEVQFSDAASSSSATGDVATLPLAPPQPPYDPLLPPPPPPPGPLQRAASMPEFVIPKPDFKPESDPIIEEVNEDDEIENENENENENESLKHRTSSRGRTGISNTENLPPQQNDRTSPPPSPENRGITWDFFFPAMENGTGPSLADVEDNNRIEREEKERKVMMEEKSKRSEIDGNMERKSAEVVVEAAVEPTMEQPPPPPPGVVPVKKVRHDAAAPPPVVEGKRSGKGGQTNVNLLQIFSELDDCFLKASESAHEVSKMLEANRLYYHSNFADNRGHIDHSARVMRVITWNRSFRGLPNADDGKDEFDKEENETHATVLDKMLAWEKKLYDEVKAGDQMKFEYQKKIASLNKLKKRGTSTEALERTKATVSHLHTRYIVDMQSMDSTVSEINRLRDDELYPKLVQLVDGMATVWESMRLFHENQSKIVQALRSLDITHSPKETSEHHHNNTHQLWLHIQQWHSQFQKLMAHQKEYIKALNNWLKLNLIPIDNNLREKVSSPQRPQNPLIQYLLRDWHDCLEKLPEESARSAIYNLAAVVDTIYQYQAEEMKMRDTCEKARKELTKSARQFENWYNKHMQKWTPADEMDPERAQDKDDIVEQQIVVETLKKRLEEEEEAYQRQCIQVRNKSLTNLKTGLPEVFRAISEFSRVCSHMYRSLKSHTVQ